MMTGCRTFHVKRHVGRARGRGQRVIEVLVPLVVILRAESANNTIIVVFIMRAVTGRWRGRPAPYDIVRIRAGT